MKNIIIAIMLGVVLSFAGCKTIQDLNLNNVQVKNVSVLEGITVAVNNVECTFSFTTDRERILDEIKSCLIEGSISALAANGISGLKAPGLDSQSIMDAEAAADLVLAKINE